MLGSFILKISGLFLSFLLNIILVRIMGLEEYGKYYYILSIINFLSILAIFGLDNTGVKYLTKYYVKKDFNNFYIFYTQSERFVLRTSLLIVIAVILSTYFLFENSINNFYVILICSLLIPLKSLTSIYFSILRAIEKLYIFLSLGLIVRPILLIFLILVLNNLLYYKINLANYILVNIVVYISIIIFTKSYIKNVLPKNNISDNINIKSKWLLVPFYIFFIQSVNLFNLSIDNIIINYYDGASAVSLFSVASNISNIVGFTLSSINIFLAPKISNLYHSSKTKSLQSILIFIAKINLIFGVISTLTIIIFGKNFLKLYDNEMIASYPLILILIIGQLFHVFCGSVTYLMIMTKLEKIAAMVIGISALLNVIMNIILIPHYGLIGCCIATTISTIFYNFLSSIIIIRKLKLNATIFAIFANK